MRLMEVFLKDHARRFFIVLSLSIMAATAWMALTTIESFRKSEADTELLERRIRTNIKLASVLVDMETGQRGYVLSGNPVFLERYEESSRLLPLLSDEFLSLYKDAPGPHDDLDALKAVMADKIAFMNHTIELRSSGSSELAASLISSGEGKTQMDNIRAILSKLETTDRTHINQHHEESGMLAAKTRWTVFAGFGIGISILFTVFLLFDREVIARKAAMQGLTEYRDELERSNEELEHFAYVASHDLQEPLRKIASFAQLLERKYKQNLDETGLRYIGYLVDGAHRMSDLINDLLMYSRVGRKGKPFAPVDLNNVTARVKESLSMAIQEAGAAVKIDPMPTLEGDESQLAQVLQNLVANALKFRSQEPPLVRVQCREEKDRWVFTVQDNGIGIAPEHQAVIFRMFQRLHTREEYPGTGIGLALCKRIVNRHGGDIWVESPPEGGSAFRFTISKSLKERA